MHMFFKWGEKNHKVFFILKKGSSLRVKDQKICNSFFRHKPRLRCGHCDSGKLKAQDNTLKMAFGEKQDHKGKDVKPRKKNSDKREKDNYPIST